MCSCRFNRENSYRCSNYDLNVKIKPLLSVVSQKKSMLLNASLDFFRLLCVHAVLKEKTIIVV